jgi:hypothetical protein
MAEEKTEPSHFRVVDRRSFTADGVKRKDADVNEAKAETSPAPPRATPRQAEPEPREEVGAEALGFDTLVSYLSTTAMFQMGLIPGPGGERIPVDLPNARRTIDLLEVLQEKTEGNLTPDETRLLEDVLYELRMSFVEMEKRQARKGR